MNETAGSVMPAGEPAPFRDAVAAAYDLVVAGGPVAMVLVAMSVLALAIFLLKLWQFRAAAAGDRRTVREVFRLYHSGRVGDALMLAGRSRNPVCRVLVLAIRGRSRSDVPESRLREEVVRLAGDQLDSLRSYFRPLEVIASLAPLLGLFGTVLGMIDAFQQLEQAGSRVDPSILSGGIWVALLTTAFGLAVAIPVVAGLSWLERVVERLAHDMESVVTRVFTHDLLDVVDEDGRDAHAGYRAAAAAAGE